MSAALALGDPEAPAAAAWLRRSRGAALSGLLAGPPTSALDPTSTHPAAGTQAKARRSGVCLSSRLLGRLGDLKLEASPGPWRGRTQGGAGAAQGRERGPSLSQALGSVPSTAKSKNPGQTVSLLCSQRSRAPTVCRVKAGVSTWPRRLPSHLPVVPALSHSHSRPPPWRSNTAGRLHLRAFALALPPGLDISETRSPPLLSPLPISCPIMALSCSQSSRVGPFLLATVLHASREEGVGRMWCGARESGRGRVGHFPRAESGKAEVKAAWVAKLPAGPGPRPRRCWCDRVHLARAWEAGWSRRPCWVGAGLRVCSSALWALRFCPCHSLQLLSGSQSQLCHQPRDPRKPSNLAVPRSPDLENGDQTGVAPWSHRRLR